MRDRPAGAELLEDVGFLVALVLRNDPRDRLADHLGFRVAEEIFGAAVPARDGAVESPADDRVVRRGDDRSELRLGRLRPLSLLDVFDDRDEILRASCDIAYQRNGQVDPDDRTILTQVALLHRVSLDFAREQSGDVRQIGVEIVRMRDGLKIEFPQFIGRVTDDLAKAAVDRKPATIETDMRHTDGCLFDRRSKARFDIAKCRAFRLAAGGSVGLGRYRSWALH